MGNEMPAPQNHNFEPGLKKPTLSVFVLCYNRVEMAIESISSIQSQLAKNIRLIISDNSTNDELLTALEQVKFNNFEYRKRSPSRPVTEHINQCMSEVDSDYFMLFHDDDLLNQDALSEIFGQIALHPQSVAFGINAMIEVQGIVRSPSFNWTNTTKTISSPNDMLNAYFGKGNTGIAPFPGYVYSKQVAKQLEYPQSGGKNSDVEFLMRVASLGPIVWITKPLMTYRIHNSNDSNTEALGDRLKFLAFLKCNPGWVSETALEDYRYFLFKISGKAHKNSIRAVLRALKLRRKLRIFKIFFSLEKQKSPNANRKNK